MSQVQITADLTRAPADLREFLEGLAADGISATLPTVGPQDPVPDPLVVRASLSTAIVEERQE